MTAATALLRQIDAPPLPNRTGICAAAIVADADALASEWSTGSVLSMIPQGEAAKRNAEAIIVEAAVRTLARAPKQSLTVYRHGAPHTTRAAGLALADLLQAYQDGLTADDDAALEAAAEAIETFAAEAAEWFRLQQEDAE